MAGPSPVLRPLTLAIGQLDDPAFVRVLLQSLALSALCFAAILAGALWGMSQVTMPAWLAWIAGITGTIGASLLAFWLFLPMAAALGTLFIETIAGAVERRHYPDMPPGNAASLAVQVWDGIAVGLKVLMFSVVALVLAVLLPGIGLVLAWAIAGYGIGRGLFVAVAMRRMSRVDAELLYRQHRGIVLAQGGLIALASYVPLMNLLIPLIGTAAMVHVLDHILSVSGALTVTNDLPSPVLYRLKR
jgi:CysZ protein